MPVSMWPCQPLSLWKRLLAPRVGVSMKILATRVGVSKRILAPRVGASKKALEKELFCLTHVFPFCSLGASDMFFAPNFTNLTLVQISSERHQPFVPNKISNKVNPSSHGLQDLRKNPRAASDLT